MVPRDPAGQSLQERAGLAHAPVGIRFEVGDRVGGPEAYREMRELAPRVAPVIFMTGYSPELVRGRLEAELNAGAGLLQKPYDADTLGRKVREVLDAARGGGR